MKKRIKLPLSRLVGGLNNDNVLVLEQEPDEALTLSMYIVLPEQVVEVEIDEDAGEAREADTRKQISLTTCRLKGWHDHVPGNHRPVPPSTKVLIRLRNGMVTPKAVRADRVFWGDDEVSADAQIVSWRRA